MPIIIKNNKRNQNGFYWKAFFKYKLDFSQFCCLAEHLPNYSALDVNPVYLPWFSIASHSLFNLIFFNSTVSWASQMREWKGWVLQNLPGPSLLLKLWQCWPTLKPKKTLMERLLSCPCHHAGWLQAKGNQGKLGICKSHFFQGVWEKKAEVTQQISSHKQTPSNDQSTKNNSANRSPKALGFTTIPIKSIFSLWIGVSIPAGITIQCAQAP